MKINVQQRTSINRSVLTILLIIWVAMTQFNLSAQPKTEWKLARHEKDIAISYRWTTVSKTEKIREMQAVFTIDSPSKRVIEQFTDAGKLKNWSATAEVCEIIPSAVNHWQTYMRFGLPWPLKSADLVSQCELIVKDRFSIITMNSCPLARPIVKNVSRINSLQSEWKFIPISKARTKVIYQSRTFAKPEYPRVLTDGIIQTKLIESIIMLQKQAS